MSRPTINAPHGTMTRYTNRKTLCRCNECREAMRLYRLAQKARPRKQWSEGEIIGLPFETISFEPATFLPGLRGEREARGMNREDFSLFVGCEPSVIARLEDGARASVGMATKIQAALVWERREREGRGL